MKNLLFESYNNAITKMDLVNIKPFTETELQPLYSTEWVDTVIKKYINSNIVIKTNNPSVLRSMLVMDLMDCGFSNNNKLKPVVFGWYQRVLNQYYSTDLFSLETNTHNLVSLVDANDFIYFADKDPLNLLILNRLFELSYKTHGDIYADNMYEVIGPFNLKSSKLIVYRFHSVFGDVKIDIYAYFDKKTTGTIDLFAHSTYQLHDASFFIVSDYNNIGEYVNCKSELLINIVELINNIQPVDSVGQYIKSRCIRYKNIVDGLDVDHFFNIIQQQEKKQRIIDIQSLTNLIKF